MLYGSSLGLLGVIQKGARHYVLDEGHVGKFQRTLEKIMLKGEGEDLIRSRLCTWVCGGVGGGGEREVQASGLQGETQVYSNLCEQEDLRGVFLDLSCHWQTALQDPETVPKLSHVILMAMFLGVSGNAPVASCFQNKNLRMELRERM